MKTEIYKSHLTDADNIFFSFLTIKIFVLFIIVYFFKL